jgi:hypothetical protein
MKKLLGIIVLGLLLSGNAYAGVNEPGVTSIAGCDRGLKFQHKKLIKKHLKELIKKKQTGVLYASCNYDLYSWAANKGKDLEKLHKKTYKQCMKSAKKHTGKECYLYAVNDEIVWKYDKAKASTIAKTKIAEAKTLEEKNVKMDTKLGRFFEDQPDVSDDYQIHFIYLLTLDGKDTELDISGWIEKRIKTVNKKFLKMSAKNKKSNGIGQQFKLDMTKEGKLDVTFVRMNVLKKQLNVPDYPSKMIYHYLRKKGFDNPKKVYATFTGFKSKHGNSDGGEGFVPLMVIYTPAVKTYGQPDMDLVILHELFHTQAAAYGCGKRTYKGAHVKGSDILAVDTVKSSLDSRNDTYYRHDIEGCPDLAKSVFVTPTAKDSWDPYDVFCRKKRGNLTHPDLYTGSHRCKGGAN